MMQNLFSLSQIIGYIAVLTYVAAYLIKDDNRLKIAFSLSNLFWITHYIMIGAHTGAATTALITIRNMLSLNVKEISSPRRRYTASIFSILLVMAGWLTWSGLASVLAVAPTIAATYAVFYLSGIRLRLSFLLMDICWFAHGLIVDSVGGEIYAVGALIVNAYTIYKLHSETRTSSLD